MITQSRCCIQSSDSQHNGRLVNTRPCASKALGSNRPSPARQLGSRGPAVSDSASSPPSRPVVVKTSCSAFLFLSLPSLPLNLPLSFSSFALFGGFFWSSLSHWQLWRLPNSLPASSPAPTCCANKQSDASHGSCYPSKARFPVIRSWYLFLACLFK